MRDQAALQRLMDRRQIWQAGAAPPVALGVPSGIPDLDEALPLGGWPPGALTEVLQPACGLGELQLLMPTITRLTRHGQRVVMVAPPFVPFAPAWRMAGVRLGRLDIIDIGDPRQEALWALECCLRSASCAAVIGWPVQADHTALRRLQLAADHGRCLGFVLRHSRHAVRSSPAALRLRLLPGRRVQVLKCRGGALPAQCITLPAFDGQITESCKPIDTPIEEPRRHMPCHASADIHAPHTLPNAAQKISDR
ncbi:MAG: translesion DNA synthesis-associated protein ImuA [Lautropia sp.]|nr:translesion DNA synthesis-associated protein ImuA [Lautropia sp.]